MMMPQIRDQFIPLCNLVCEESYDGVLRQSATLLGKFFAARDSVLLLLDSTGHNFVVTLGAREGDAHWSPEKATLNIEQDREDGGPFAQVALTRKALRVEHPDVGYRTDFIEKMLGSDFGMAVILPLLRPDRQLLGVALVAGAKVDILGVHESPDLHLFANALGGVIYQKLTEVQRLRERNDLRKSLSHIGKDRDELRDKLLVALQERIPGRSAQIAKLHRQISRLANFDGNITLLGPEGSGKERIAQELHRASRWQRSPFVFVNCPDLNEDNFAPLLFGNTRGAIKGLASARKGYIREAGGGMLYFNRVDLLSPDLQGALARVLEKRSYRALGAERDIPITSRFVFSAPPDLPEIRINNGFLSTLFFRITQSTIRIPPLTTRKEDVPDIALSYIAQLRRKEHKPCTISDDALLLLSQDQFTGDVRELESKLERAFMRVSLQGGELLPEHLIEDVEAEEVAATGISLPERLALVERGLILAALKEHNFDRATAADSLKIPKRTLADKCKKYQI